MKKQRINLLEWDNYIAAIENGIGSKIFRNLYAEVDGNKEDIAKNGRLSCALHVSSILFLFGLIEKRHSTVNAAINDLKKSGWKETRKPEIGSVIVWDEIDPKNSHKHIGFFVGNEKAVSNSSKLGHPIKHHWTFGFKKNKPVRKIEAILWNKNLNR